MRITIWGLARKNIQRNLFRSIAVAVAVAAATATIFSVSIVMQSVKTSLTRSADRLGADLILVPFKQKKEIQTAMSEGRPFTFYMEGTESLLDQLKSVQMYHRKLKKKVNVVESVSSQLYYLSSASGCCDVSETLLVGFDPADDFTVLPWMKGSKIGSVKSGEVLVGDTIPHQQGFKIRLYNRVFVVAGKLEPSGNKFFDNSIFMPTADLKELMKASAAPLPENLSWDRGIISAILVRTSPLFKSKRIGNQLGREVRAIKSIVTKQVQTSVGKQLFLLLKAVLLAGVLLWTISFLIISVIFSMIVNERVWEIGILRAMGATRAIIFRLTVTEAAFLSLLGGGVGILVGGGGVFIFRELIVASFSMSIQIPGAAQCLYLALICLSLGLFTGISAVLLPAIRSSLMEPATAVAKGQ